MPVFTSTISAKMSLHSNKRLKAVSQQSVAQSSELRFFNTHETIISIYHYTNSRYVCIMVSELQMYTQLKDLTILNKIATQGKTHRWQVDKETIYLSRVQEFFIYVFINFVLKLVHIASIYTICR